MCACLPLTKPLVVRMTRWVQKMRGLDTEHQGWTTVSNSQSRSMPGKGERGPRTITRVDEYEINLLAVTPTRAMTEERDFAIVESQGRRWSLQNHRPWETQKQPWETMEHGKI